MKISMKTLSLILISTVVLFTACKKDDKDNTIGAIELTGEQNTPLILENRFESLTTPDYVVTGSYTITAAVSIQPGTVIVMKPGAQIVIEGSGSLKSIGTAELPIRFTGESKVAGSWNKLLFKSNNSNNQLIHTIVEHGGGDNSYNASVYCYLNGRLRMNHLTVRNGRNYGVLVYSNDFVVDQFANVLIHNTQLAPVKVQAQQFGIFDETFVAHSNGFNRIEIEHDVITLNTTVNKTTVPYFIRSGFIDVQADLSLNPGVNLIMGPNTGFSILSNGSFKAIGTALENISIIGEQALNGYWNNIRFTNSFSLNNEMQYCTISHGGNDNSWNGMIYLYANSRVRIGNSTISNSQTYGILNYTNSSTLIDDGNNIFSNNTSGDIGN